MERNEVYIAILLFAFLTLISYSVISALEISRLDKEIKMLKQSGEVLLNELSAEWEKEKQRNVWFDTSAIYFLPPNNMEPIAVLSWKDGVVTLRGSMDTAAKYMLELVGKQVAEECKKK